MQINEENNMELSCNLRFIVSSLSEFEVFNEHYRQYNAECHQFFKDKTKYVVSIELTNDLNLESLEEYINNRDDEANHDFFISFVTNSDSEIIEVPKFVVECIRKIGGKVNFSFTYVA